MWSYFTDDTAGEIPQVGPSAPESELEKLDGFTQVVAQKDVPVAPSGTVALSMGNITTAKGFWLRCTGSVSLVLNGDVAHPLVCTKPTGAKFLRSFMDVDLTSLSVINAGTSTCYVTYRMWA